MKMPFFLRPAVAPLAGLDIGSHHLTWVELAAGPGLTWRLERCLMEPLAPGWVLAGRIEAFDQVAGALTRLVSASGSRTRQVALAMPDAEVMTHRMALTERLNAAALRQRAEAQAEQDWSAPVDELCVDFGLCDAPLPGSGAGAELWVASARKDPVQDRLGLAEAAGLQPLVMEAKSHALRRALQGPPGARLAGQDAFGVALVEVGADVTTWQVLPLQDGLHGHNPSLTGALVQGELDMQSIQGDADLAACLARELGPANAHAASPLRRVVLTGERSAAPGLQTELARLMALDCGWADPFEAMTLGPAVQHGLMAQMRLGALTACGLAWRRFAS